MNLWLLTVPEDANDAAAMLLPYTAKILGATVHRLCPIGDTSGATKPKEERRYYSTLKEMRSAKGWTQVGLAKAAGLAPLTITAIETGKRKMGLNVAKKLAKALDQDIVSILRQGEEA